MATKLKIAKLKIVRFKSPKVSIKKLKAIRTPGIKGVTSKVYTANIRNRFRKKLG